MRVRLKEKPEALGHSTRFNTHGIGEVIVGWDDDPVTGLPNGMDTVFIRELEVWVPTVGEWMDMKQAFKDRYIVPDNYNVRFSSPLTEAARQRGWND